MSLWKTTWNLWHEHPRERVKLALGWLFHRQSTHAWLSYLHQHEALWRQVPKFPKLVTRIYRPYALRRLNCPQRVQHMIGHHDSLQRLGLLALLERSVDQPLPLLQLPTKGGTPAELRLVSVHDGHREGEMHLQLHWDGQWLYSLSFLLRQHEAGCEMVITRLQGTRAPQARDLIRAATKGLHGQRPAALLVQAARQLAHSAGCPQVLLVSHRQRVALNPMRRWKLQSDLETLWQELGAQVHHEGFFVLSSLVEVPDDFSDVASHKRAEARRKADVLRQTLGGIDQAVRASQAAQASA